VAAVAVDAGTANVQRVVARQARDGLFGWHRFGAPGAVTHPAAAVAAVVALLVLIGAGPFRRHDVVTGPAGSAGLRRWHWSWLRWAELLVMSAAVSTWFLGGWALPGHRSASTGAATGWIVLLVKTALLAVLVASTEVAWPRLRGGDTTRLLARWLLPLAGADLLVTIIAKAAS
jgi:NADH:ubiquinone oxidoreductase subunit H